ncbi:MAG: beta-lactamase family protein [Chloroflexota bacterium]|nr:beta-lactamase family protein [Chloroflexota bacterium]
MRRSIAHVTGAAAVLVAVVAASLALAPASVRPVGLSPSGASHLPETSAAMLETRGPSAPAAATAPPDGFLPVPHGLDGVGTARPVDLLPVSATEAASLQTAVDRARTAFGLGAVAVGVSADGQLGWSGASGPARDGHTPLSGTTPFAIASVTKTFTAAVVLQLVEEGRIRLDALVTDYLPGLAIAQGVTVQQLLSHTSGIADLLTPMRDLLNAEPSRTWQPEEVVALIGPSRFAPGSDWGYSNTNYVIAGMLVEEVTGNPFADELARRVTGPLKLQGTGFSPAAGFPNLLGRSWASAFWTSAALDSNAADLVRWGDALYGGAILRPSTLQRMLDFNADGYGLGAERYVVGGQPGYGHSGLLRGYTTLLVHVPEARLTLAVLATGHIFDPTGVLTYQAAGAPSILSLAGSLSPS